jgi:hypothetical protein
MSCRVSVEENGESDPDTHNNRSSAIVVMCDENPAGSMVPPDRCPEGLVFECGAVSMDATSVARPDVAEQEDWPVCRRGCTRRRSR